MILHEWVAFYSVFLNIHRSGVPILYMYLIVLYNVMSTPTDNKDSASTHTDNKESVFMLGSHWWTLSKGQSDPPWWPTCMVACPFFMWNTTLRAPPTSVGTSAPLGGPEMVTMTSPSYPSSTGLPCLSYTKSARTLMHRALAEEDIKALRWILRFCSSGGVGWWGCGGSVCVCGGGGGEERGMYYLYFFLLPFFSNVRWLFSNIR